MWTSTRFGAWTLLVGACIAAGAEGGRGTAPLRTLVTAHAAHSLVHEEAARAYPVHLRGVVTYFDPYSDDRMGDLFVHDRTGSIFVKLPHQPILNLQAGDVVDVVGVSGPGDFAPIVDRPQVRVVAKSHVPARAPRATFEELLSGGLDGQWVEFEGLVHAAHVTATNAILDLTTAGGSLTATTRREPGVDYESLIDTRIRLHGNAAPVFNWKWEMVGVHLFFPSFRQIQLLQPAPPDPFEQPVIPIASLLRFEPGKQLDHRVHVQGTVTLQWPGLMLCLQQSDQTLCMKSSQARQVVPGDFVDAIGFPAIESDRRTLEDATFRLKSHGNTLPLPVSVTAEEALGGQREGELVSLDAEMVGQHSAPKGLELLLRSHGILVTALLPKQLTGADSSVWKPGSSLHVSGICRNEAGPDIWALGGGQIQPGAVQILLRSADDVQLLRAPSWWTPEHTFMSFATIGVVVVGAFAWILILRHSVKQRTCALRRSEERLRYLSEHDPLTGLPNRVLLNERLQTALKRAWETECHLGLLMIDLDGFKAINDELGHQAGDQILCELAGRLRECVRMTDTVARIGGDEFIVLLPNLHHAEEAASIASKIVTSAAGPFAIGGGIVELTLSIGVVTCPDEGTDESTLMRHADEAMYAAKSAGKNRFAAYGTAFASQHPKNHPAARHILQ